MYEYDDGTEGGRPVARSIAVVVALVGLAVVGWFVVGRLGGDGREPAAPLFGTTTTAGSASLFGDTTTTATTAGLPTAGATTPAATDTIGSAPVAPTSTAAITAAATPGDVTYETLPDGSPAPVVALYDVSKITITGAVPDQAAKDRLQILAIANAKPGQDTVENFLTINPSVPRHIGVRVVELTSVRFPEGSAEVLPPHALELDRVVSIMNALPNVTALVIGHADQRGEDLSNYEISEERAGAVVDYIAGHGIAPSRLSSRAVGETDLLTLNNDPAALELNRRTEFVFYGLLLD